MTSFEEMFGLEPIDWDAPASKLREFVAPGHHPATYGDVFSDDPFIRAIAREVLHSASIETARQMTQWGLSDVRAFTGEIAVDEAVCPCTNWQSPVAHTPADHKGDCATAPPCGGCYRCMAQQDAYYRSLK